MSAVTRRDLLRIGTLGALALPELLRNEARAARAKTKVRSVILIQHYGAPSHIDLWDPKPDAPADIRGEFSTIATSLPGYRVTEIMPRVAKWCHRLTLVRAMTHRTANHNPGTYQAITGHTPERDIVQVGASPNDWPAYGSVMARFLKDRSAVPPFVQLPHHAFDQVYRCPGQGGGWLGRKYDPFVALGDPSSPDYRFELSLPAGLTQDRLEDRRSLLRSVEKQARGLDSAASGAMSVYQERAFSILTSSQTRKAFDLSAEPTRVRERYGNNKVGQSYLLSRRLVEAGVRFVTCFNGSNPGDGWDTHDDNFNRLKKTLVPPDDQAFSALLEDLDARGLLDTTLVVWAGEFGRKPEIARAGSTFVGKAGRDHWPQCYTIALAGGGTKEGFLYGSSDRIAKYPKEKPTTPADLAATLYWATGIDPHAELPDLLGRPLQLTQGTPVTDLFS
jgi:hypothetical protein